MLLWLSIAIISYLFFGLASLGDKLVLNRSPNPKLYTFYVGALSSLAVLLIPFVGFHIPDAVSFFWIAMTSLVTIAGLYVLYCAVAKFEVSRVVPIIGAVQPILVLLFSWFFWGLNALTANNIIAFLVLLISSVIISFEKRLNLNRKLLIYSVAASFLVALGLIFIKMVFLRLDFLEGIIWIGICNLLLVLMFFFNTGFRQNFFIKKTAFNGKTLLLVLLTQSAGAVAGLLQNFAIFLAPISGLAIINALRGVQYVFLFAIALLFSFFYPRVLKEEITKKIIIQKAVAILLIVLGLIIL